ncbi:hypothetical protein [Denitrobaculum tricleocarpae]|uniref:Uncharacterized protein n=1 Tax=Denitrobaculum tricleocarpae TaxID=2591009 RepID=A0A545TR98_9PROT|nr:hypothetical protein [Denitrobaculum tricleocarpae]TQV79750.1 hypothetical protein FKG95_13690 [Denitrobaculum tricleocarpae]
MNSIHQTSRSHQPALRPSEGGTQAPSMDRIHQDMAIYLRRGHKARSEAFHSGFKFLSRGALGLMKKLSTAGDAIERWLFTPSYSGGRKS